jgi:hypothetical protein
MERIFTMKSRITEKHTELQPAVRTMLQAHRWTHFVTLNTNHDMVDSTAIAHARHWCNDIKSRLFRRATCTDGGGAAHQTPSVHPVTGKDCQWLAFAALEHTQSDKPHIHLLLKVRDNRQAWFERIAPRNWLGQCKYGSIDIQTIHNQAGAIDYATKLLNRPHYYDSFFIDRIN